MNCLPLRLLLVPCQFPFQPPPPEERNPVGKSNGPAGPNTSKSERSPQRIVLLAGDEHSDVKSVLAEYPGADLEEVDVKDEVTKFAAEHAGKCVAVEWRDGLSWRRFLWCRQ